MASQQTASSKSPPTWILGVILLGAGAVLSNVKFHLPGDIPLEIGITMATAGIVMILFPVIKQFYLQPLDAAITERNTNLERTFAEAEELKERMDTMKAEYEKRLQETEAAAREQIQAQIKEAQQLRQSLMADATAKADELLNKAAEEIEAQKQKLVTELRVEVVNLTLGATERLLGENMDTEKNRRLVKEFIEKVEVAG